MKLKDKSGKTINIGGGVKKNNEQEVLIAGDAKLEQKDGKNLILAGLLDLVQKGTAPGYPDVYNAAYADAWNNFIVPRMAQRVVIDHWDFDRAMDEAQASTAQARLKRLHGDRFRQVIKQPVAGERDRFAQIGHAGDHNDRRVRVSPGHLAEKIVTLAIRQMVVQQRNIESTVFGGGPGARQVVANRWRSTFGAHHARDHTGECRVIIEHKASP